jgi:hypothetical protein
MAGIDIGTLKSSLPDSFKEKGIAKIKTLILNKGQEIKTKLTPALESIISKLPKPDEACLSENQVQKILDTRNNLVNELNKKQKNLNLLTTSIGITSGFLGTLIATATVIKNIKTTLSLSAAALPVVPGPVVSAINAANEALDTLRFDDLGNSKLNPIKTNLEAASISVALTATSLKTFISALNNVDTFLKKCAPNATLEEVNNDTLATVFVQQFIENNTQTNNSSYNDFSLEIEEKQYNSNIVQKRAVAKNNQGIIVTATEYSFTSTPEVLLNELKLIIDRDNLKGY